MTGMVNLRTAVVETAIRHGAQWWNLQKAVMNRQMWNLHKAVNNRQMGAALATASNGGSQKRERNNDNLSGTSHQKQVKREERGN